MLSIYTQSEKGEKIGEFFRLIFTFFFGGGDLQVTLRSS